MTIATNVRGLPRILAHLFPQVSLKRPLVTCRWYYAYKRGIAGCIPLRANKLLSTRVRLMNTVTRIRSEEISTLSEELRHLQVTKALASSSGGLSVWLCSNCCSAAMS